MTAPLQSTPLTTRLTQISVFLATKRDVRTRDLQERFGVSQRTIARDVKAIRQAGIRVSYDSANGTFRMDGVDF